MQSFYSFTILLIFLSINTHSIAAPVIKLCIEDTCKKPLNIKINDATWAKVKDLYNTPFSNDKDEQDNIASSISLIESDVYQTLATAPENTKAERKNERELIKEKAEDLFSRNTTKNNYKNIKSYIGILLDSYLVTRHFMRKTINQKSWSGLTNTGILLQSLGNSQLYILEIDNSDLGSPPVIRPYHSDSSIFGNNKTEQQNTNSIDDDDFE